jgi:hypothetical protein
MMVSELIPQERSCFSRRDHSQSQAKTNTKNKLPATPARGMSSILLLMQRFVKSAMDRDTRFHISQSM